MPMGVFGSVVPVVTLGSISKRWVVPGWRVGWLVTSDPNGIIRRSGVISFCIPLPVRYDRDSNVMLSVVQEYIDLIRLEIG